MSVALSLWFVIIISIVTILIVVIYKAIYRSNMNKALKGEEAYGLMDLGQFVKMLVFVALIIMNIVTLSRLGTVQNQLYSLQSNYSNLNSQLTLRINNLQIDLEEYFAEEALVQSFEYELIDIDGTDAMFHISFSLSEIDPSADVYLAIEGDSSQQLLVQSSTLTYETDIVLKTYGQYTLNLLIEGDTVIQELLVELDVETMIHEAVSAHIYPDFIAEEESEILTVQVVNTISHIDSKQIDTVHFQVYYEDEILRDEVLNSPSNISDYTEVYKMYDPNVEAFIIEFEDAKYRWSEVYAKCTITLMDGTTIILNAYL